MDSASVQASCGAKFYKKSFLLTELSLPSHHVPVLPAREHEIPPQIPQIEELILYFFLRHALTFREKQIKFKNSKFKY